MVQLRLVWHGHDVFKFGLRRHMDLAILLQDPMPPNIIAKCAQFCQIGTARQEANLGQDGAEDHVELSELPRALVKLLLWPF